MRQEAFPSSRLRQRRELSAAATVRGIALSLVLAACTTGQSPVSGQAPLVATAAPPTTPGVFVAGYDDAVARARAIIRPLARDGSAISVAVGVNGRPVWSQAFGRRARDGGSAVRPETPFRLYSLMKQVTAVLALQSALRGEVELSAPVRRIMPELPPAYAAVTLQQLLTHTGGVRHYRDSAEARMTASCATAAEALPLFIDDPLVAEPGTTESYSTWGFVLASALLERAAGMPFDSLLLVRVARPAGMTRLRLEGASRSPTAVAYYDLDAQGVAQPTPPLDNSCKMGGGGFVGSAEDLVRFHDAVLRGELIPLPAVRQLLGARSALLAGGSGPGGEAVSLVDLGSRVSVVILSNTGGAAEHAALEHARDALALLFASGAADPPGP